MTYADTWAVRPAAASTAYLRAAAAHGANAVFTLLHTDFAALNGAKNGCGYRVSFTTSADITPNATVWIITGRAVGSTNTTTETVTGPASATTVYSTTYWASMDSIVASGTAGGSSGAVTVAVGYGAGLALPRCRIRGIHYVGAAAAGAIVVTINTTSGTELVGVDTPASATFAEYVKTNHVLVGRSAATSDFGIVTLTNVTYCTLFLS